MDEAQYSIQGSRDVRREAAPRLWQPTVPVLPQEWHCGGCGTGHTVATVLEGQLRRCVGQTLLGLMEVP